MCNRCPDLTRRRIYKTPSAGLPGGRLRSRSASGAEPVNQFGPAVEARQYLASRLRRELHDAAADALFAMALEPVEIGLHTPDRDRHLGGVAAGFLHHLAELRQVIG